MQIEACLLSLQKCQRTDIECGRKAFQRMLICISRADVDRQKRLKMLFQGKKYQPNN